MRFYRIDSRSGNYFRLGSGKLETLTGAGRAGKLLKSKSEEVCYVFTTSSEQFRFGHRPAPYLWSTELVAALKRAQSTGFRVSPANVICDGISVHGFESVIVEGRGGALDALRSEVERWSQTGKLALLHNATYMIESEWDGSDVFTIRETGNTVYCTEKAAAAIRDLSDLKDLRLTSNEDASMP